MYVIQPYSYMISDVYYYVHTSMRHEVIVCSSTISISHLVLANKTKKVFSYNELDLIVSKYRMMGFKCDDFVLESLQQLRNKYEPASTN